MKNKLVLLALMLAAATPLNATDYCHWAGYWIWYGVIPVWSGIVWYCVTV